METRRFDEATANRRALLLGIAALAATPLLGCASGPGEGPALLSANDVKRNTPPGDAPVGIAADGLAAFGHRLLEAAAAPGTNFVSSPLSLAVAFAMLRVGAAGVTASELDSVFGFPSAGRDAAFNAITRQLITAEVPPEADNRPREANAKPKAPIVSVGNALFPQKGFQIAPEFLRTLAAEYGAGVRPVDFTGTEALKQINDWVTRQTAGRIKKVFEDLDGDTKLVLANAVYFKADWETYFLQSAPAPFTKADGAVIQAQTLQRSGLARYAEVNGLTAIELAYAGGPYAMWIILPARGGKPEEALTPAVFGKLRSAFSEAMVEIAVPKWDFATSLDLREFLPGLGLQAAFRPDADFSGIAEKLYVSEAIHRANITVDEWGTEAAAVTGIGMAMSALPMPTVRFIADRPFAFAIVGGAEQIPMFTGRVSDPTAK